MFLLLQPHSITAPLRNSPRLDLHKVRFSGSLPLPKPTLKIEEAHSLAPPKLHMRQSALSIQSDDSGFLFRAECRRGFLDT